MDNFTYFDLHSSSVCGKLSTTTNVKKPPISRRLRISDIRKGTGNTFAELRIQRTYPAAPLRIWLIRTLIVSNWVRKSRAKLRFGRSGVYPSGFLFLAKQKSQPKLTRLLFRSWRYGEISN